MKKIIAIIFLAALLYTLINFSIQQAKSTSQRLQITYTLPNDYKDLIDSSNRARLKVLTVNNNSSVRFEDVQKWKSKIVREQKRH